MRPILHELIELTRVKFLYNKTTPNDTMLFEDFLYSLNDFEAEEGRRKKKLLVKFVDTHLTKEWRQHKRWVTVLNRLSCVELVD